MSATAENLEVFILTRNRADLLKKTIQSLLQQTVTGFPITILDNASTDHTAEVVGSFHNPNLHFIPAEKNIGGLGNIQRSQKLAARKYVMLFHDDDQLHPSYLASALDYLSAYPDTALVVSSAVSIPAGSTPVIPDKIDTSAMKFDRLNFALSLYMKNKIAFCSAVYRTDCFKALKMDELAARFGKWGDRPIMIETVQGDSSAIVLNGAFVYYGRHDAQDTGTEETQPPYTLWLNRERYYKDILSDRISRFSGLCFCVMSHRHLKSGYKRRIIKGTDFTAYLKDAFALGATTNKAWALRRLAPRLIQNALNSYARIHLRRHNSIPAPAAD